MISCKNKTLIKNSIFNAAVIKRIDGIMESRSWYLKSLSENNNQFNYLDFFVLQQFHSNINNLIAASTDFFLITSRFMKEYSMGFSTKTKHQLQHQLI